MNVKLHVWTGSATNTSNCDKEIKTRIGKKLNFQQTTLHLMGLPKIRISESIILALFAQCRNMVYHGSKPETLGNFHHTCLRRLLNVT